MPIVLLVVIGAVAGYLATRLMRVDTDVPTTIFLGVLGALVGGFGLRLLSTAAHWLAALIAAVLGAMALIWLWRVIVERR
jgi:uncharacterized membrane protein YeaQ/YmgE (transglycosylase-associated protein family)